jgi:hypothetical protein
MNSKLLSLTAVLLCLGAVGCGASGSGGTTTPSNVANTATLPQPELKGDSDSDSDSYGLGPDPDTSRTFGYPVSASEARAITALVKRYYAIAATEDGARACTTMYSALAESLAETYGGPYGVPSLRGTTCAQVLSKLFKQRHGSIAADSATLRVVAVRALGRRGSVLLSFGGKRPTHYMEMRRELGSWKIDRMLDGESPILVE